MRIGNPKDEQLNEEGTSFISVRFINSQVKMVGRVLFDPFDVKSCEEKYQEELKKEDRIEHVVHHFHHIGNFMRRLL